MASKRKSTVPCMIPSKSKHAREEIILGSLPELLPTIPEDSILSISGEESGHCSHKTECASETQKGGTYSCHPCHFESRDLNYFLDHMHNCHLDFRAQPTFYCLNCGMSVVRFEALALHNANTHPKIMQGLVTASLMVNKRDGITTVEQNLFTDNAEDKESGIPLIKTPIAKMMKSKGEQKKIVVSHTVEVRKIDTGKDIDPSMLTNVPELQNGAPSRTGASAMPRTTVSHEITTTVSNHVFHQHTPSLYSPPSSDSNKDLPKVMIPLSSIPTYDAAMDTSSFLKTSFGKFPYPTKAELCYLTVVSEFPEEQIKLWFTAQRLKQGISWSPEEIDEARRKMFNTVFQGGAPQKLPAAPRQVNHIVHHTVHQSLKGPNFPMAKVPYGIMKTRPVGVIAKHANMSTNPNVTRVSYSTSVLPPRFPSAVRTSQVLTKNTQATVEPDKSNGMGLDLPVSSAGLSGSSSRSSSCSSSMSNGETVNRRQGNNNSQTNSLANISNNEHCVAEINGKESIKSCSPTGLEEQNGTKNAVNTSKANPTCNNHISGTNNPPEQSRNSITNEECSVNTHKNTNSSVTSEYTRTSCIDAASSLNHASKPPTETTSSTVITMNNSSISDETKLNKEFSMKGMSILQQLIKDDDPLAADTNGPELKLHPLNINFKRIKMNAPEIPPESVHQEHKPEPAEASQASFSPPWSNKTPQQLHILRQVFSSTRWPSSQQYEELSVQTGLPKSEVVRWFSDSRYSHKNGQLKWLETYQRLPADPESQRGHGDNEPELQKDFLDKKKLAEQDMIKHLEGGGLNSAQQMVWQDSYPPLLGLMGSKESNMRGAHEEAAPMGVLQGPWSESAEDHQQPVANQSLIDQQNDTSQARDRLRMELLEV
ncbi:zinc fingers and homeoboxes protein 3 [Periophthalmus magnuspinnatus]|uniref:zinc fingers and homeoboxes protein 3 n=1 Tax=Periophthalmus magnuspinnatus TaxID=409849 RepID=UPI00145B18D5|nr:zinc fingers and homeoboxes protein 3 [Periophthalmus magnuspinnatus]XP_055078098.1 zinc fingers and homeoboxes protein 3 [Periophthalmus magnuspinnatus]XP_055078099.1 zinc fingers and homeoboxes protein 3 [Periophthalmus magnuspinnatus]